MLVIRRFEETDWSQVWRILEPVFRSGETYAFSRSIQEAEAIQAWVGSSPRVYVAEIDGEVVGSYYLKPNQPGQGGHVCNCGYVVATAWRGMGIAGKMCLHSLQEAHQLGFYAMQYNLVVSTNEDAIHLWRKMGFEVVGRLPGAFNHPGLGFVDALVMYQKLAENPVE